MLFLCAALVTCAYLYHWTYTLVIIDLLLYVPLKKGLNKLLLRVHILFNFASSVTITVPDTCSHAKHDCWNNDWINNGSQSVIDELNHMFNQKNWVMIIFANFVKGYRE